MATDPEAMRALTRLAADSVTRIGHLLDVSPYISERPNAAELRVRFWATLLAKAQERYHEELLTLTKGAAHGD